MTNTKYIFLMAVLIATSLFFNLRGLRCGLPSAEQTALIVPAQQDLSAITPALKETRDRIYLEYEKTHGSYLAKGVIPRQEHIPVELNGKRTLIDIRKLNTIRAGLLQSRFQDEQKMITSLTNINPSKLQFNPRFFQYGGIFIYSSGLAIKTAELFGLTRVTSDITYYFSHPSDIQYFFVAPKALCGILETLAIPLIFLLGRMLYGTGAGVFAALFLAILPAVPVEAHSLKPYILFFPFMLSALIFSKKIMDNRLAKNYILAGVFSGLSAGTLIFSGVVGISALCAHFFAFKRKEKLKDRIFDKNLLWLSAGFIIAFFAFNPAWLTDFGGVKADYAYLSKLVPFHFSLKNIFYSLTTEFPKAFGLPLYLVGASGIVFAFKERKQEDWLILAAFFPAYFYIVSTFWSYFHYLMPVVPLFIILAGRFAAALCSKLKYRVITLGAIALVSLYTLGYTLFYSNIFVNFDGFMQDSGRWINGNIPARASIYTPVYPHFSTGGYPPFSLLDYKINEEGPADYIISVSYEQYADQQAEVYTPPDNYSLLKLMSLDNGLLGRIYDRKALIFLDPEIGVYKLKKKNGAG